jgi:hypothetical protein
MSQYKEERAITLSRLGRMPWNRKESRENSHPYNNVKDNIKRLWLDPLQKGNLVVHQPLFLDIQLRAVKKGSGPAEVEIFCEVIFGKECIGRRRCSCQYTTAGRLTERCKYELNQT